MKKNGIMLLLVIFIIISVSMGSFVLYDKLISKDTDCPGKDSQNEKIEPVYNYTKDSLAPKYINISDENNYIVFDKEKGNWNAKMNFCDSYEEIYGTYTVENDKVILRYIDGSNTSLNIISDSDSSNIVEILHENLPKDSANTNCMESKYFVKEK